MKYWLMKSEPGDYSIDDLKRDGREPWTGVRNFQARNYMHKEMAPGDLMIFYHSSVNPPGAAGVGRIAGKPYPDPTQFDRKSKYYEPRASREKPVWYLVDVTFAKKFRRLLPLRELKQNPKLMGMMALQSGSRLSITPLTHEEFAAITKLGA